MDHHVFRFATRGQCIKRKKLDCFEHNHVFYFKLQCASIVVLLWTAIWWQIERRGGPLKTKYVFCDQNIFAYFHALPSGGKSKDAVAHWKLL